MALRILAWVGPLHVIGGIALFATAFFPDFQQQLAAVLRLEGDHFSPFLLAVLGPTIASWGVLFTALVRQYADFPTRRVWNALVFSIIVWAAFDTSLCVYFGVSGAVVVNVIVVVVLLWLLYIANPRKLPR